jgi:hypothetical protein
MGQGSRWPCRERMELEKRHWFAFVSCTQDPLCADLSGDPHFPAQLVTKASRSGVQGCRTSGDPRAELALQPWRCSDPGGARPFFQFVFRLAGRPRA